MRFSLLLAALLAAFVPAAAVAQDAQQRVEWNRPIAPFNIIGNVYYVGTEGLSAFLVTGPRGHVLIDGGLPESAPHIAANIRTLGFKLRDVRYLLVNHTHFDHAGGLAELKQMTGAQMIASADEKIDLAAGRTVDRPELATFAPVTVDRIVRDGELIRLGSIMMKAHMTPGHTRGGVSWTTMSAGKRVLFATSLTVAGQKLVGDTRYPTAAADFRTAFRKLRLLKADVFLNFHPEFFDMATKRAQQTAGNSNAFVDPGELGRQVDRAEENFKVDLATQSAASTSAL